MDCSPTISIFVQPPIEDQQQCAPLDFGDVPVVDPPFDFARHNQYLSGSAHDAFDLVETYTRLFYGKDANDNLVVPQDRHDLSTDYYPVPPRDNPPSPYGPLSYNTPRSPVDNYSPCSSTLGDDFSPNTSPSINGGALSPSSFGEPLSPTLLPNLSLPFTEMHLDSRPAMFRYRSQSVSEGTVAPADTWCDPTVLPVVRSAPSMTAPLPPSCDISAEYGSYRLPGRIIQNDGGVFTHDEETSPDALDVEQMGYHSNGLLLFQQDHASPCQPPTIDIGNGSMPYPPHHRGHSDSSGFLSPTSPDDRHAGRLHQRRMSNAAGSVRHTPYPASAPSTPEGSFSLPELAGANLLRRHSGPSSYRPRLSINVQSSENNEVFTSQQYVYSLSNNEDQPVATPVKSEWSQSNEFGQLSPSIQFASGMTDQLLTCVGDPLSPDSPVSTSPSSGWKKVVGSAKIVKASNLRRKRDSKFVCTLPECGQTFTAKHNLTYHMLSHSGERRFACDKCQDRFTTPGVASRHRVKCTGSGGSTKRRRSASSAASSSKLPLES